MTRSSWFASPTPMARSGNRDPSSPEVLNAKLAKRGPTKPEPEPPRELTDRDHRRASNQLERSAEERDDGIDLNCARNLREHVAALRAQIAHMTAKLEAADLELHRFRFYDD